MHTLGTECGGWFERCHDSKSPVWIKAYVAPRSPEGSSWYWEQPCGQWHRSLPDNGHDKGKSAQQGLRGYVQIRTTWPERFRTVSQTSWFGFPFYILCEADDIKRLFPPSIVVPETKTWTGNTVTRETRRVVLHLEMRDGCVDRGLSRKCEDLVVSQHCVKCWTCGVHWGCILLLFVFVRFLFLSFTKSLLLLICWRCILISFP